MFLSLDVGYIAIISQKIKNCDISHTIYRTIGYNFSMIHSRVGKLNAKEAVANRILQLCSERGIAPNALANLAGISPSTVYSVLNAKSQNPGIVTLKKLCDGLEISLKEFFDADLFDTLEQEIR